MVGIKLYSNMTGNKAGKWPRIKLYSNTARSKAGNSANNYLKQHRVGRVLSVSPVVGIGTPPPL
jgi:hypothetical protein